MAKKLMLITVVLGVMVGLCVSQYEEDGLDHEEGQDFGTESEENTNPLYEKIVEYGNTLGIPCARDITLCADIFLADIEMEKEIICSKSKEFSKCVINRCELAKRFDFVIKGAVNVIQARLNIDCKTTQKFAESDARLYGNALANPAYEMAYPIQKYEAPSTDSPSELCQKLYPICLKMMQDSVDERGKDVCDAAQDYVRCLETECVMGDLIRGDVVRDAMKHTGYLDSTMCDGQAPLRMGVASAAFLLVAMVTIRNLFYGF